MLTGVWTRYALEGGGRPLGFYEQGRCTGQEQSPLETHERESDERYVWG